MISLPPKGNDAKELGSFFSPLSVQAQTTPNMTVSVSEGAFWTSGNEHQEFIGGTSPIITAPATNAKWVLVTVTTNGALSIVDGASSANPILPDPSTYKDELPLAALFIGDTVTAITNDMIFDIRPLWSIPSDSVSQSQLNDFTTVTQLNNGLATKADADGTNAETFTISVGTTSSNNSGFFIDRSAGSDVGIRFNETATAGSPPVANPQWEFTNDGTTWNPIGVAAGSFYTKPDLDGGALNFLYYTQNDLSVTGVLDARYYTETESDATFSIIGHTHMAADITDFPIAGYVETINSLAPVLGDVTLNINDLMDVSNASPTNKQILVSNGTNYVNRFVGLNDLFDVDTTSVIPAAKDVLVYNGGTWTNRPLVKDDISDFLGNEFLLLTNLAGDAPAGDGVSGVSPDSNSVPQTIYGVKTFNDGVVINGTLVVSGVSTTIETSDLTVFDPYVDINASEVGPGVGAGAGVSGIRISRGNTAGSPSTPLANAIIQWDEGTQQWEAGLEGSAGKIVTGNHTHLVTDITDFGIGVTTELASNDLNTMADVTYLSGPNNKDHLVYNFALQQWENKVFAVDVKAELNVNVLEEMMDVSYPTVAINDCLQWTGAVWVNHAMVKSDITDFVEADYIHTTGNETKTGNLDINGNFTVQGGIGSETRLKSEHVYISDTIITLNADNVTNGSVTTAGLEVIRGNTFQNALLRWDEGSGGWAITTGAGASLVTGQIEVVGHTHNIVDIIDVSATANEIDTLGGINTGIAVQTQLNDKISRTGDVMDVGANLTFALSGEVLGLPAVPSVDGAASSKKYVDDQILVAGGNLTTHIADLNLHMTADQNTFLDSLTLTGSPALVASDVNQLIGISGNVQALLDLKTDLTVFNAHGIDTTVHMSADQNTFLDGLILTGSPALVAADVNQLIGIGGNVQVGLDSKIGRAGDTMDANADLTFNLGEVLGLPTIPTVLDAATSKQYVDNEITTLGGSLTVHISDTTVHISADQNTFLDGLNLPSLTAAEVNFMDGVTSSVQTQLDGKTVKTIPATTNNLAALNASGDLIDSGVIVNDAGVLATEIWTASKIDTTKTDKVSGAVLNNFASLDASGNLLDSGFNNSTYASAVHTHVAADVTDFNAAADARIAAAVLDDLSNVGVPAPVANDILQFVGGNWVNKTVSTVMVDYPTLAGNNTFTGINQFNNNVDITGTGNLTVAGDITINGTSASFQVTTGTFANDVVIGGDLTVNGTTTTIGAVDLVVTDKNITLNNGYSGATTGSNGGGIHIVRNAGLGSPPIPAPQARIVWEELVAGQGKWKAGIEGIEDPIALVGVTKDQPDYTLVAATGTAAYTLPFMVPTPAVGKTGLQVFVNGIKQIEGATKAYTVAYATGSPAQTIVTFNVGSEPIALADVEFYGFGYIG